MNDRIWSIQYLRAFAALGVVFYHAMEARPSRFEVGAAGVDVFFVISGFIMASLAMGRESSPGLFLWRRAIRIAPLYWIVTLVVAGILMIQPLSFYRGDASVENIVLSMLFIPHYANGFAPVVLQGWTLEYEMFFYVLFAAALFAPARIRLQLLCGAIAVLAAIGLLMPTPFSPLLRVYTNPLLLEFVAGIGLAVAWRRNMLPPPLIGIAAIVLGFALYAFWQMDILPSTPHRFIHWGIPAALIVAGALSLEAAGKVGHNRFGALLGDSSYSLYLTHTFVVAALGWYWPQMDLWLHLTLSVVGSIVLAIASYLLLERPMTNALKSLPRRKPRPAIKPSEAGSV